MQVVKVVFCAWGIACLGLGLVACSSNTEDADEQATRQEPVVAVNQGDAAVGSVSMPAVTQEQEKQPALTAEKKTENDLPYHIAEVFAVGREVYVRSLEINDASNTAWVGTSVGALEVNLTTKDVKGTYTRREGLANEYIFAILNDSEGRAWFGTNGGGVSQQHNGAWRTYFPMHGLADYWVYSFGEQADKSIWIGTWAGVNHLNPETGEFTTYIKELINEWVYGIAVDKQDRVWFGTEGGISMFDGHAWQSWSHEEGLGAPNSENLPISTNTGLGTRSRHDLNIMAAGQETYNPNYVFCVMVDQAGDIWAGTWGGGVSRFDGQSWHNLTTEDGLASNVVFSMTQDVNGVYWFGTDRGLSSYDGTRWYTYTRENGLMNDSVYAVHDVANGEIWVGTKSGVARMAPKQNKSN